jgi:hypothetical protein
LNQVEAEGDKKTKQSTRKIKSDCVPKWKRSTDANAADERSMGGQKATAVAGTKIRWCSRDRVNKKQMATRRRSIRQLSYVPVLDQGGRRKEMKP